MRPITNILLVVALICYVILPFYDISFHGSLTGLEFTAGTISQSQSLGNVLLALLPFLTCFGAIWLNCLRNRWWVLGTIACILLCLWFYNDTHSFHDILLQHKPEVTPDNDLGEGFSIIGLGIGYKLSLGLTIVALVSAIVSMLPFKFNQTIEKAVDDTFEDGRRHVREEFNKLENSYKQRKGKPASTASQQPTEQEPTTTPPPPLPTEEEDKEDPSRFMPKE